MAAWMDCLAALKQHGLLLKSDSKLPSVTTIIARAPVRGSWWAHPQAQEIFRALKKLARHRDVLLVKLIAGKDTLVDRRLWPEILAIATAGEPWQWKGVSAAARAVYQKVSRAGEIESSGSPTLELETRLLARGEQFHTGEGSHARRLETWEHWADRVGLQTGVVSAADAKRTIEAVFPGAKLAWASRSTRR